MLEEQEQTCLYLMCGLPCSGKTTFASQLAKEKNALVFSLDKLVLSFFPEEDNFETHRKYVQRVQDAFFPIVSDLLWHGCSIVMDFPAHTRNERDQLRQLAIQAKVKTQLYYLQADLETIAQRIQQRNAALKDGEYYIPGWLFTMIIEKLEPPDVSENAIEVWLDW
ncbi:MAG: AAA family ATPase [Leptolyngbya sp. IPPAS B-1204]|nr:MAG: ATP-binding protein [Leptolyngbya sp. IPPAS B-1204]